MQLISKFNNGFHFLLCIIDVYSKYAWIALLEDEKGITTTRAYQEILDKHRNKPNNIWVNKGSAFYNRSMKSWLQDNDIEMYSTHNEGKPVAAGRFIRTLKNKVYKYMTSISKSMCIDILDYINNKNNNTYDISIKMNPVDVSSSTYFDFDKKDNKENSKFKVGDHESISKYKNIFAKGYVPNLSEGVFLIKKVKNADIFY